MSFQALKMSQVDTFYLHQPDTSNSLTESLRTVNELIKAGTVQSYGLSNYSTVEVERVIQGGLNFSLGSAFSIRQTGLIPWIICQI